MSKELTNPQKACNLAAELEAELKLKEANPALEAIRYALDNGSEEPMTFLELWLHGDFEKIRENWDNVPDAVFIGADPLWGKEGES